MRVFVVVATAVYAAVNAVLQLAMSGSGAPGAVATAHQAILAAVVVALACALMRVDGETIFAAAEAPRAGGRAGQRDLGDARIESWSTP